MKIIAFTGTMGSGKTTATNLLKEYIESKGYQVEIIKFAQSLYELQDIIYKHLNMPKPLIKDRVLLQLLGTEWGRKSIADNIWVSQWEKRVMHAIAQDKYIICDDCRFNNEAKTVKILGGSIIKLIGPSRCDQISTGHESEKGISDEFIDYSLDNSTTTEALNKKVIRIFAEIIFNH